MPKTYPDLDQGFWDPSEDLDLLPPDTELETWDWQAGLVDDEDGPILIFFTPEGIIVIG